MENLIFSLNAVLPVFFTMILGWFFHKIGLMDEVFSRRANRFVFQAALPALVFQDLAEADFLAVWDTSFVLFCFLATLISILGLMLASRLLRDKCVQGEFVQASYRSSAALLGIAFIQNIYGSGGMGPLMIIATVPLYNVMAVVVLSVMKPDRGRLSRELIKTTLKGIAVNPIILGILLGVLWSVLKIPMPGILRKTVQNLGAVATPLGLMAMGATFDLRGIRGRMGLVGVCSFIKLIGLAAVFLPVAVWLGFTQEKMIAILVMLGSATTVSCFIMAKNMGHEGSLTSGVVALTTLLSSFTLTFWLFLLKSMQLI